MTKSPRRFCRFHFAAIRQAILTVICAVGVFGCEFAQAQNSNVETGNAMNDSFDLFSLAGTPAAAVEGKWSDVATWPINGLHAALLPNGEVMTYGLNPLKVESGFVYDLWDPRQGLRPASHTTLEVQTDNDIFCSAQNLLPGSGGMLMVTGGSVSYNGETNLGISAANVFDPLGNTFFQPFNDMHKSRWYPTLTGLNNGTLLATGGRGKDRQPVLMPELFFPSTGKWKLLSGANSEEVFGVGGWSYPRTFMAPNGKVLVMPSRKNKAWYLDTAGQGSLTEAFTFAGNASTNRHLTVMYRENKLLSIRGTDASILTLNRNGNITEKKIDGLSQPRHWAEATILANGEVLVSGGSTISQDRDTKVTYAEIWNPDTEKWRIGAEATEARLYHSATLLLPSGAVVTGGGNPGGGIQQLNAEVYYPDHLFSANGKFNLRPRILGVVPETDGRSIVEVRARGDEGTEKFNLIVDGQVVRTFSVSTEMKSYFYFRNQEVTGSQVRVEFINDQYDPPLVDSNLHVDYIEIDGVRHETQNFNVESFNLGEVGNFQNETLFSNGYFHYWDRTPATKIPGSIIEVKAAGNEGIEKIRLLINNTVVETFEATRNKQSFYYRHVRPVTGDQIKVEFVRQNHAPIFEPGLNVDYIKIDGFVHPTEHRNVFSETEDDAGFLETETLTSDGYFQYWNRAPANLQMGVVDYASTHRLFYDYSSTVEKVMLIKFGSATHSVNMGQLATELDFVLKPGKQIEVQIPNNPRTCTPGHYMMFFINDKGTPSQAAIMEVLNL